MDFAYTAEDEAFRRELTTWLDENLDRFLADRPVVESGETEGAAGAAGVMKSMERRRAWQRKLNEGRWGCSDMKMTNERKATVESMGWLNTIRTSDGVIRYQWFERYPDYYTRNALGNYLNG